ncbi:hypothetical protein [Escherichia coli]|uniref:hypothetical protein n=1 Tax=Escherichia coli TaxID=562 RepID=UPI0002242D7F|nr:hypothetical protein [Escherichia coli]EFG1570188.1 hypothetical protein [Escherichia coli]EFL5820389.1 hypothetical protein [Escherichia coli]EGX05266.1 hypothetical protein ECSTECMHI813_2259 [Escherichia coli STEC_MHI813]EIP6822324.1 hypothetical protein [Escherichia coli]MBF5316258.1 hypothetical protein [Escherichia coli]
MLKIFTLVVVLFSSFAYGESITQAVKTHGDTSKELPAKSYQDVNRIENQQLSLTESEKQELYSLINKNSQAIELLVANQEKLINEVNGDAKVDYSGWTSILLACVGIIITVMSVILALISIIGYRNFRKSIELSVKKTSTEVAKQETVIQIDAVAKKELVRLIDEGALAKHLESAVDMIFLRRKPELKDSGFDKYPELDKEEGE